MDLSCQKPLYMYSMLHSMRLLFCTPRTSLRNSHVFAAATLQTPAYAVSRNSKSHADMHEKSRLVSA